MGCEFEIWCRLIRLYWENGFGDMDTKLLIYGGGLWPRNMGRRKGVGALEFVEGLMVVVYGEVLVTGGKVFLGKFF